MGRQKGPGVSLEPIGVFFILLGILALRRGPIFGVSVLIPCMIFGSSAALILAGTTIQPAHLLLGFTAASVLTRPGTWSVVTARLTFPREGFWFVATAAVGIVGAFILPRFFAGASYVAAIGATSDGGSAPILVPLSPTTGNLTQSVYFIGDIVCFLICYIVARTREGLEAVTNAVVAYCALNIFFAAVDLATFWTGTAFLLDFMRNTTYTMHDDTVVNGLKRINGSFTEAAAFASSSMWAGSFALRLWLGNIRPQLTFWLALINLLLVIFCTSTSGYVALPVVLAILYAESLLRLVRGGPLPRSVYAYLAFAPLLLAVIVAAVLLTPALAETIYGMIQDFVLNKGTSQSAAERGMWNQTALETFFATYGLGAGIGTVRASSFPLAVLANLGAIGALTYGIFILMVLFKPAIRPLDWATIQLRAALRIGCLVGLIMATISGTLIDLGLPFYMLAGIACATCDLDSGARKQTAEAIRPARAEVMG
ncbi:hypothetical protein BA190_04830 [Labrys sp. WJW]|nr:hypothetical protein BA190_04830 [Labrys sp. WJW]